MPYRIERRKQLAQEIRRIAEEQIDRAIAEVDDTTLDADETVHQVRKRCKKLRALLRLVRLPLDDEDTFRKENSWFRDAASDLSGMRDAEVQIATCDALMAHPGDRADHRIFFESIRRQLAQRRDAVAGSATSPAERLVAFRARMEEARARVAAWAERTDDSDALLRSVEATYRRGRKTMLAARRDASAERFHEWRKRTKDHWYHCSLLVELWPPVMPARRREVSRLAELLGDGHDLSVLGETLTGEAKSFGGRRTLEPILEQIEQRREELREKAWPLGTRVFAEKPKDLGYRLRRYWKEWE